MTTVAAHIRVLARPPSDMAPAAATRLTKHALAATRWGRQRRVSTGRVEAPDTSAARHDLFIEVAATERRLDTYAAHAHELVQLLYDTNRFQRVEADLPVAAFDPGGAESVAARRPRRAAGSPCSGVASAAAHDWALTAMRLPEALALMTVARRGGVGIVIGHPDSGYSDHPVLGLGQLLRDRDRDVIDDDADARDPLRPPKKTIFRPLPNPGHGTSTAAAIVGVGEQGAAPYRGVAPAARLVPIRTTESVVQVFDFDVAKAVRWARTHGCHVVSMSLGGKGLFGLEDAIQDAVDSGMIVLAAAGNQVGFVTAPASYDNCIGVAASTAASAPWSGSSHGSQVDLSAPGACVWAAMFDWKRTPPRFVLGQSNGTSYAVAHVAGVVALWLAHHGRAQLIDRYGAANLQALLLHQLNRPGVCRRPAGWNASEYGAGIVDAEALLRAPLPAPHEVRGRRGAAPTVARDSLDRLASQLARPRTDVAEIVDRVLGPGTSLDAGLVRRFEGELAFHLATEAGRTALIGRRRAGAAAVAEPVPLIGQSPQLAARRAR